MPQAGFETGIPAAAAGSRLRQRNHVDGLTWGLLYKKHQIRKNNAHVT